MEKKFTGRGTPEESREVFYQLQESFFLYVLWKWLYMIVCPKGGGEGGRDLVHLEGHTTRVIKVQWNPHIEGQLLSISFDGTARVSCLFILSGFSPHVFAQMVICKG